MEGIVEKPEWTIKDPIPYSPTITYKEQDIPRYEVTCKK